MELISTIDMMMSPDYKVRFKAEYYQTVTRTVKLKNMISKYKAGKLEFKPACPIEFLECQVKVMEDYIAILEARADIEKIKIPNEKLYINQLGTGFVKEV